MFPESVPDCDLYLRAPCRVCVCAGLWCFAKPKLGPGNNKLGRAKTKSAALSLDISQQDKWTMWIHKNLIEHNILLKGTTNQPNCSKIGLGSTPIWFQNRKQMKSIVPTKPKCLDPKGHEENNYSLSFGWAKQCLHCSYGLSIIGCVDMLLVVIHVVLPTPASHPPAVSADSKISQVLEMGQLLRNASACKQIDQHQRYYGISNPPAIPNIIEVFEKMCWDTTNFDLPHQSQVLAGPLSRVPNARQAPEQCWEIWHGWKSDEPQKSRNEKNIEKQESWFIPMFQKQNITNERDWTSKFT